MRNQELLHGLRVLVTRPAAQAGRLCRLIETAGGEAVRLPAIEILDPVNPQPLEALAHELPGFDLVVFVSVNAVHKGLEFILARGQWPVQVKIATVGARSAEALAQHGLGVDLVPEHRFNSEALLALDELQDMRGKRVLIFRGNGGREVLHDTLVTRGAEVEYAEVYRRARPEVDPRSLAHLWQPGVLDVITITSNETLQNLFDMAGPAGQPSLREIPLVVASQRQSVLAGRLGFRDKPLVADNAGDTALVSRLVEFASCRGAKTPGK